MTQAFGSLDRVGDFALLDDRGEFHQISRYQHRKASSDDVLSSKLRQYFGQRELPF